VSEPTERTGAAERVKRGDDSSIRAVAVAPPSEVLGSIPTGATLRTELAAAAHSRGATASNAADLEALRDSLAAIAPESINLDAARRRVAEASSDEERLKERVATLRGDVRARREVGAETEEALAELESAASELASAQTERIAAEQALERARERADRARDERERRLKLRDRLGNERREARRELANEVYPAFRNALIDVPGGGCARPGADPSAYEGPSLAASLAAVEVADLAEPVVLGEEAAVWVTDRPEPIPESVVGGEEASELAGSDRRSSPEF